MPCYFSTSSPEKEYLIQFQMNRYHLLSSPSNPSLSIVIGKKSGWESCLSLLYSLCTCGTVEHIKLMHSQGTQRILGAIYAFMGVGFVFIINLFSLVIDILTRRIFCFHEINSQDLLIYFVLLQKYKNTPNHNKILQHFLLH